MLIKTFTKTITAAALCSILGGCALFHGYQPPFTQGNVIVPSDLAQIHSGMPASEVQAIMGSPILVNTFSNNHFDYVYQTIKNGNIKTQQKAIVHFSNGVVSGIDTQ